MKELLIGSLAMLVVAGTMPSAQAKPTTKARPRPAAAKTCRPAAAQTSNAAFNGYIARIRPRIENNWYLADGRNHVTLSVTVAQDGSVTDLNLSSSPTSTQAEQAANDAFNKAQPLEALPGGTGPAKMILTFDSYADPHGDSNRNLSVRLEPKPAETKQETTAPAAQ